MTEEGGRYEGKEGARKGKRDAAGVETTSREHCLLYGGTAMVCVVNFLDNSLGSLSTRVFETRTVTGSELFSLLTCLHTTTFTLLSILH